MRASSWLWPLAFPLLALLPVGAVIGGCTDEVPTPPELRAHDAGPSACTPGKLACVCASTGGCDQGLLCISGRCLATEGRQNEQNPDIRPTYQPPDPAAPSDSGSSSSDSGG